MSAPRKAVSIEEPESMSPLIIGKQKELDEFNLDRSSKPRAATNVRRPPDRVSNITSSPKLRPSLVERRSSMIPNGDAPQQGHHHALGEVFMQMAGLIREAKAKRRIRKTKRQFGGDESLNGAAEHVKPSARIAEMDQYRTERRSSEESQDSFDLEKLEGLLERGLTLTNTVDKSSNRPAQGGQFRQPSSRKLRTLSMNASSDTDHQDGDIRVPSCEAILDNSKTMSYLGGTSEALDLDKDIMSGKDAWESFKFEIVRLTHTLRLKGWRAVPMEKSREIDVERLSGALTNAVYVVSPPSDVTSSIASGQDPVPKKPPPKLLLRIYGPQVEHLIDREAELQILRRLARKNIGARLLGTFTNGRFEEFFHARTLKPQDLRIPDTSEQIAKRMRELHDGIELLEEERLGGPFVWKNWDKWLPRCEEVLKFVDHEILADQPGSPISSALKERGLICGVEWPVFRGIVERYRTWLDDRYGGHAQLQEQLVFAHNDTQYGNILRLEPPGESPLLLPANSHKQLVVIDFEYANANVVGFEFANHFSEWCYNYHDPNQAFFCNTAHYPTPDEQRRFIRAYVQHQPRFPATTTSSPRQSSVVSAVPSQISSFMLDNRASPGVELQSSLPEPAETAVNKKVDQLVEETRLWRIACSAHWVAWGVVQAHVPGLPSETSDIDTHLAPKQASDPLDAEGMAMVEDLAAKRPDAEEEGEAAEDEAFDYLSYAKDRAMLFWGDVIQLGLIKSNELPEEVRKAVKILHY